MFWANDSAIELWGASTLDELKARNFSDMSESTTTRLTAYLEGFYYGKAYNERWSFYPQGYPETVDCHCSGIELPDGRVAMLVEGTRLSRLSIESDSLRMTEALRHTNTMVSLYTITGEPVMRNPSAIRALGDPAVVTRSLWDLPIEPEARQALRTTLQSGKNFSEVVRVETLFGERWFGLDARVVQDPSSGQDQVLVNANDRTDQYKAEAALERSEQMYRQMFEKNSAVKLLVDPLDGSIVNANQAACRFYKYSLEQLTQLKIADINTLSEDQIQRELESAKASQRQFFRFKHRLADGEIRDVEVHSGPVMMDDRQYLYSIIFDVTTRNEYADRLAHLNEEISEERKRLDDIITATQVGTWEWSCQTGELVVNERWAEMLGYTLAELVPISIETWQTLCHADDLEATMAVVNQMFRRELDYYDFEFRLRHKAGHWVWILARGQIVEWDDQDQPLRMSGTHTDISERKQGEQELTLAASVFTHAREGILITDPKGRIVDTNSAFTRITGYSLEDVVGKSPNILNSGQQKSGFYRGMWRDILHKGYWAGEVWNRRKNGEMFAEYLTISAVYDRYQNVQNYVGIFSDITSAKRHQQQLEHLAHFDALTGLPNRVLLGDRLHRAMVEATRSNSILALAFIDLDGFKAVNDTHGHKQGDTLLRVLASRMENVLRDGDTLARLGGDEFVAVVSGLESQEQCSDVLARLLSAASLPVELDSKQLRVSASIGVTFYPQDERIEADQLLRQADQAMYQAKLRGKNAYSVFQPEQYHAIRGQHETLELVKKALEQGQFALFYQPKVNLRSGELIGVEALLRWNHPELGILAPGDFLPAIENLPFSVELGEWVTRQALSQCQQWQAQDLLVPISVNISAYHLQTLEFPVRLKQILDEFPSIDPALLQIELLESNAVEDIHRAIENMTACQQLGVSFALDDFGTGYSSLAYLKRLPVSTIKIDQDFVRDILVDIDDLTITTGVLGIANAYRLPCIAEGAETEEHCEILLRLGCELVQGYGIARPMPAEMIPLWHHNWSPRPVWRDIRVMAQDELAVLYAETEHRAWLQSLLGFLSGQRLETPDLESNSCGLGHWLESCGYIHYADHPLLEDICELLEEMAERARKVCVDTKVSVEAADKSEEIRFRRLSDHLINILRELYSNPVVY